MFRLSYKSLLPIFLSLAAQIVCFPSTVQNPFFSGKQCASFATWGLMGLVKNIDFEVAKAAEAVRIIAQDSILLESVQDKKEFIKGMIEELDSWKVESRVQLTFGSLDFSPEERAKLFMLKEIGLTLLHKQLKDVAFSYMGQGIEMNSWNEKMTQHRILFPTIFLPLELSENNLHLFAIGAISACPRAGISCNEIEPEIVDAIKDVIAGKSVTMISNALVLAIDLIEGELGKKVTEFLCKSHLFASKSTFRLWRFGFE